MAAWASILAVYNYDPSIFDDLTLPTAADLPAEDWIISDPFIPDKSVLVRAILMRCAELPLVYTDPTTLRAMISVWSAMHKWPWTEQWKTLLYKYVPIWNKDGSYTETRGLSKTESENTTSTGTVGTSASSSGSVQHDVTGFDTNSYSPDTRDSSSSSGSQTVTNNLAGSLSGNGREDETTTRTETGNIGVTTTQQMIREQREIAAWNFYDMVIDAFKHEFCLLVY